jgi:hypothetical protein
MTLDKITIEVSTNSGMTTGQLQKLLNAVGAVLDDAEGMVRARLENEPIAQRFDITVSGRRR